MNNEDKILSILETLVTKVDNLEQGQVKLEQGQVKLEQGQVKLEQELGEIKQKVTGIELTIENEIRRNIQIVAENHLSLNDKLDKIIGEDERINY